MDIDLPPDQWCREDDDPERLQMQVTDVVEPEDPHVRRSGLVWVRGWVFPDKTAPGPTRVRRLVRASALPPELRKGA